VTGSLTRSEALALLLDLLAMPPVRRRAALLALPPPVIRAIEEEWWWQAHGGQIEPETCASGEPWRTWAIIAGRGFGKTRAGAEWVSQRAREHPRARIALVGATLDEVANVMVEGESGLLDIARSGEHLRWIADRGLLIFPSGARAFAHTAARPDRLRGFQHHFAWCDELAKWKRGEEAFDNLLMGLRLGETPRTIVTTTPRPLPLLKRILALPRTVTTNGRSDENLHSASDFRTAMREMYAGTRLGRQELDGILFDDPEGALWTREILEKGRVASFPGEGRGPAETANWVPASAGTREKGDPRSFFRRIVIGVDPPASSTGDACGIVVCGVGEDGIAYVLADLTARGLSPEGWARRVAAAAAEWNAQRIVAEKNQGGDMVESMLRGVDSALPVRLVHASKTKEARAEPVALRFETGRAKLAGRFPALEDELCAMTYAGYEGPGSPDRADAMVWAMSELIRPERGPRIRRL